MKKLFLLVPLLLALPAQAWAVVAATAASAAAVAAANHGEAQPLWLKIVVVCVVVGALAWLAYDPDKPLFRRLKK